jgi:hypothetical protein
MSFAFRPAKSYTDRKGCFVSLVGSTNSGKTVSALRLARGIAGPKGRVAVLDTEAGRTLHLKDEFDFDAHIMEPPFRPEKFAEAAKGAEESGYDALVIDSFSMEWVGLGGVIDWQTEELDAAVERAKARNDRRTEHAIREANKMASWIKPKTAHKAMVYSFLQRRIPIIFSIRGEETVKPGESGQPPVKIFKALCSPTFPFEMTVAFRLAPDRKGYIDLSDPKSWKMEGAHQAIFRDGEQLSEQHGAALRQWIAGSQPSGTPSPSDPLRDRVDRATEHFTAAKTLARVEKLQAPAKELLAELRDAQRGDLVTALDRAMDAAKQRFADDAEDPFGEAA